MTISNREAQATGLLSPETVMSRAPPVHDLAEVLGAADLGAPLRLVAVPEWPRMELDFDPLVIGAGLFPDRARVRERCDYGRRSTQRARRWCADSSARRAPSPRRPWRAGASSLARAATTKRRKTGRGSPTADSAAPSMRRLRRDPPRGASTRSRRCRSACRCSPMAGRRSASTRTAPPVSSCTPSSAASPWGSRSPSAWTAGRTAACTSSRAARRGSTRAPARARPIRATRPPGRVRTRRRWPACRARSPPRRRSS